MSCATSVDEFSISDLIFVDVKFFLHVSLFCRRRVLLEKVRDVFVRMPRLVIPTRKNDA